VRAPVKDTPKPGKEFSPVLPRGPGRIVRRALVKDPERRHQTAKDLGVDRQIPCADLADGGSPAVLCRKGQPEHCGRRGIAGTRGPRCDANRLVDLTIAAAL
jgi:hypothetical protein